MEEIKVIAIPNTSPVIYRFLVPYPVPNAFNEDGSEVIAFRGIEKTEQDIVNEINEIEGLVNKQLVLAKQRLQAIKNL